MTNLDKTATWKMFDSIAGRYDFLNRLLSMGIDTRWRKIVAKHVPSKRPLALLDLGTGTGDFVFSLVKQLGDHSFSRLMGIDMAVEMLKIAKEKQDKLKQTHRSQADINFQHGDATQLKVETDAFDVVTMSFAIRNVNSLNSCLDEIYRVLAPQGRALILEFSLPQNFMVKHFYLFYFRHILPFLGGVISGNKQAYTYLNASVESFPYGQDFCDIMKTSGFKNTQAIELTWGIATLYIGDK